MAAVFLDHLSMRKHQPNAVNFKHKHCCFQICYSLFSSILLSSTLKTSAARDTNNSFQSPTEALILRPSDAVFWCKMSGSVLETKLSFSALDIFTCLKLGSHKRILKPIFSFTLHTASSI